MGDMVAFNNTEIPNSSSGEETFGPLHRPMVSLIIPTLNEAKNLPLVLPYIPLNWVDEVVLVDGRSTDGTVEVARQIMPSIHVVLEKKKGKGAAMKAGYESSRGDILIVMDADGSNDPREIPRFIRPLLEGADFVKGSRFATGGGTTDMPRFRVAGNMGFVIMSNQLFGVRWTDLCYGFHAFWRHCLKDIDLTSFDGFEIDTALYLQAAHRKLKIVEVPSFEGYRFYGIGKLKTIPDGWRVLKTIMREWRLSLALKQKEPYIGFRGVVPASVEALKSGATIARIGQEQPPVMPHVFEENTNSSITQVNLVFLQLLSLMAVTGMDSNVLLKNILQISMQAMRAESGSLLVLDDSGNVKESYIAFSSGIQLNPSNDMSDVLHRGLAGWVVKNRQPVAVPNVSEDPRWLKREWDCYEERRSALVIPLMRGEKVHGVMTLIRQDEIRFSDSDLSLLRPLVLTA